MTDPVSGSYPVTDPDRPSPNDPVRVLPGRLWGGGVATAVVAMSVALVGVLVVRDVLGVPLLAPDRWRTIGQGTAAGYASAAVLAALVATAVLHLLLVAIPRPRAFFRWIVVLTTIAAGLQPFLAARSLATQVGTGAVRVAIGVCIGSLLLSVATRSVHRPSGYRDGPTDTPTARYPG